MSHTPNQILAIETRGRELVVSAGAGAGKTSVLVERIFRILSDTANPCGIEELLVVTFSRAAAAEMRERLVKRIEQAIADPDQPAATRHHLEEQAFLLPRAAISTIHSFCLSVLTSYPEQAGLAPGFDLMSEEEARLFRRDFLKRRLEQALGQGDAESEVLRAILDQLDPIGAADALRETIAGACAFLDALPFPTRFVGEALREYNNPAAGGRLHDLVPRFIMETLSPIVAALDRLLALCSRALDPKFSADFANVYTLAEELRVLAKDPRRVLAGVAWNEVLKLPRAPSTKSEDPRDLDYKEARAAVVKQLGKARDNVPSCTPESVDREIRECASVVRVLLEDVALKWNAELLAEHLELRRLTFSHLERLALRVLVNAAGEASEAALMYRRQFAHVLVDEFQDVNELQNLILRSVARPGDAGGNLFMVGDIKQSIYGFRQAEPALFLANMQNSAPVAATPGSSAAGLIRLAENFRSAPDLLEEFNAIFANLLRRETVGIEYTEGHGFEPGRKAATGSADRMPEFSISLSPKTGSIDEEGEESDDVSHEAADVAARIARLGPPWRDICILLRSTVGPVRELTTALAERGVPTFADARSGFLTAVEVVEAQTLLRAIHNPYDEIALLGLLRGPIMEWPEDQLLDLRAVDGRAFYFDIVRRIAADAPHPLHAECAEFIERITRWQALSQRLSMGDFVSALYDELHLVEGASVRPGGDQRRLNLLYLAEKARQFDGFLAKGLGQFLEFIADMIDNQEDFAPPSPLPESADVVRIMTIHKSKGMQFPIVFYPFLGRKFNDANARAHVMLDRELGVATSLCETPTPEGVARPSLVRDAFRFFRRRKERGEELRLFYVALTRAREAVYISGSRREPGEALTKARDRKDAPLPAEVLDATCPLDWVIAHAGLRFPSIGRIDGIGYLDVLDSAVRISGGPEKTATGAVAVPPRLEADCIAARERIAELAARPPATSIRAKVSVTEAKRAFDAIRDAETPPMRPPKSAKPREANEWMPRFMEGTARPAVDRGRATHRFLALCDLVALARGARRLREEGDRLVAEQLLTAEELALVELHDIGWFLNSDLGKRLRREDARVHREKPFTVRVDADEISTGSRQSIILQGVVDVLWREGAGWILVDYKTDNAGPDGSRVPRLAKGYEPQLQLYRLAVERTLREPIAEAWLVFLGARQIVSVPPAQPGTIPWQAVVEAGAVVQGEPPRRAPRIAGV